MRFQEARLLLYNITEFGLRKALKPLLSDFSERSEPSKEGEEFRQY